LLNLSPQPTTSTLLTTNLPFSTHALLLQDVVAGDGTTSVTVMCGALLKKSLELLERGVHPTVISDAFGKAADKAVEVRGCCWWGSGLGGGDGSGGAWWLVAGGWS
jgi:hypothetical protein